MFLYHVSINASTVFKTLKPYIPSSTEYDAYEEPTIERVCLTPSVNQCLTGVGILNCLKREDIKFTTKENVDNTIILALEQPLNVTVYEVDVSMLNLQKVITPDVIKYKNYVPDVSITYEHWYLDTIKHFNVYTLNIRTLILKSTFINPLVVVFDHEGYVESIPTQQLMSVDMVVDYA